ncbi:MAG: DUF3082 domain-containing protein [Drouetiella hepatica Uher 2000/2452]|uniref:DUF3082 domain-containing protein n=1 Tax=Drouetiella hepatica Uher 2000/2452 TaxID=904376 RepID=A0A951ULL1_9CYAN|nr:DUF3082 domain-containing protein [Drouetiella hepatica Uher 2000/2452]
MATPPPQDLTPESSGKPTKAQNQPTQNQVAQNQAAQNQTVPPTPLRCFVGALIASGFATALYSLTQSIIRAFANKPLPSGNVTATNIAVAVRTLVMGMSALATAIFAIAAVGLVALGIQLLVKQLRQTSS